MLAFHTVQQILTHKSLEELKAQTAELMWFHFAAIRVRESKLCSPLPCMDELFHFISQASIMARVFQLQHCTEKFPSKRNLHHQLLGLSWVSIGSVKRE